MHGLEATAELGLKIKSEAAKSSTAAHVAVGGLADEWISYILAAEDIECAIGVVEKGQIGLNHYKHVGHCEGGLEIVQEQIWYVDDKEHNRLERKMDVPRESGWRISLQGDVNLNVDVDFPPGPAADYPEVEVVHHPAGR